jgi:hypothetical protein
VHPRFLRFYASLNLQYRGWLDASRTTLARDARRGLFEAMCRIAESGKYPLGQQSSRGCSISIYAAAPTDGKMVG